MSRLLLALLLGLLGSGPAAAQFNPVMEGGARALGLGSASTALRGDVWGYGNPASWATLSGRAFSLLASQSFALSEMRLAALVYVEPTRLGTFAGGARTFGFDAYRETRLTAGYARSFRLGTSRRFHAALTARYYHAAIDGYGSTGTVGLSVGWLVNIASSLDLGMYASNLNQPALAGREELPRTLALGLAYTPDPRLRVLVDAFKDLRFPVSFRSGLEWRLVDALALRAGVTTRPTRFTAGLGVRLGRLAADVAVRRHETLGWSPALSFGMQW